MSADAVLELVRHLTERDREIVLRLYDQQVLTTDQLRLLFFSSRRRAQDRLLFLYRHRLVDRFYPPSRFGAGKPQAHWLLDEAGALLVAAMLGIERKRLGWRRRDDWGSHPQLAHRLECNRFVTDLIAATLLDPALGVTAWYSSREAAERLGTSDFLRPDAGFVVDGAAGAVECYLEWDRGSETQETLRRKLDGYRLAEGRLDEEASVACSVLFVVPGPGRIATLRRAYDEFEPRRERHRQSPYLVDLDGRWPLLAATVVDLRREGPLAPVWQSITDRDEPRRMLTELPLRRDLGATDLALALGRRWRHEQQDFWERLSPLGRPLAADEEAAHTAPTSAEPAAAIAAADGRQEPAAEGAAAEQRRADVGILEARRLLEEELRRDLAAARAAGRRGVTRRDLRSSAIDGSMDGRDHDLEEERWR